MTSDLRVRNLMILSAPTGPNFPPERFGPATPYFGEKAASHVSSTVFPSSSNTAGPQDETVTISHEHALFLGYVLARPALLGALNRIYSFVHLSGTITFLVWLYAAAPQPIFEARRRTLALSNLLAFVVFTWWPCMPPRLLPTSDGFGFVDTVHTNKVASLFTTNRFCNQLAAMPSRHFSYSFVIGLTIATLPTHSRSRLLPWGKWVLGMSYPTLILVAIVSTANHYVLDAVAGFVVVAIAWNTNEVLKSLLVVEDVFLYLLRVHKPRGQIPMAEGHY
ncbi:PAP2 superfamily-domain-containing protein [Mycena galopus ATCC 62051]|nr:PAP2 superfamily-domain-containing protein [Mycena galopus ATCC 62051]